MTDVAERLEELRESGLYRRLRLIGGAQGPRVLLDGRPVLLLCSNNYLGLADHPRVREAAAEAAMRWGAGAGASRLISGNMEPHRVLEERLAEFKGYESALLFGSGYLANIGAIAALAGRGEVVFSDELNHASIVDGCRLSRAETFVYRHGDVEHLAWGLREAAGRGSLIVTDGVFSMDGDVAPLEELAQLARRHGCRLMVDEAHATGALGPGGRGSVAAAGLSGEVDLVVGTLGKALGSYGAYVCAERRASRVPAQHRALLHLLHRPAAAGPRRGAGGAGAARRRAAAGRAAAANAATLREALAAEGLDRRRLGDPDRPARGRRRDADDGAVRAAAGARRLRAGDPPPNRARGLLAAALHRDGDARAGRAARAAKLVGEAARELGIAAAAALGRADAPGAAHEPGRRRGCS